MFATLPALMPLPFAAKLWDLDGTLADTTGVYKRTAFEVAERHDIGLTEQFWNSMPPVPPKVWLKELTDDQDVIDRFCVAYGMRARELLAEHTKWNDGALETVEKLHRKNIPQAIVTTARTPSVEVMDRVLQFSRFINVIITGDHVDPNFKPEPHGLFMAAEQLGVEPSLCYYTGDFETDVMAAERAGMYKILLRGAHTPERALGLANLEVHNLRELHPHLNI